MYKIYINETPLILQETNQLDEAPKDPETNLVARYTGKRNMLLNYVDMLEKSRRFNSVVLHTAEVEQLFSDLSTHFKLVEAAGGVVYNSEKEILVIFRRGAWDLPKGKIDKGEAKEAAAVREVKEETGLKEVSLGPYLSTTFHVFKNPKNGRRILKKTYWYVMQTRENDLIPQVEEDIEIAKWTELDTFLNSDISMYESIRELLEKVAGG